MDLYLVLVSLQYWDTLSYIFEETPVSNRHVFEGKCLPDHLIIFDQLLQALMCISEKSQSHISRAMTWPLFVTCKQWKHAGFLWEQNKAVLPNCLSLILVVTGSSITALWLWVQSQLIQKARSAIILCRSVSSSKQEFKGRASERKRENCHFSRHDFWNWPFPRLVKEFLLVSHCLDLCSFFRQTKSHPEDLQGLLREVIVQLATSLSSEDWQAHISLWS